MEDNHRKRYYEGSTTKRELLKWAKATQSRLDRWENLHAKLLVASMIEGTSTAPTDGGNRTGTLVWDLEIERYFILLSAAQLLKALDMATNQGFTADISVSEVLGREIREARDLNEHWEDNLHIFNTNPRPEEPARRSGKAYAERNPDHGPYGGFNWSNGTGPCVTPNVPSKDLRSVVERVHAAGRGWDDGRWVHYVQTPAAPAWIRDDDSGWWPASRFWPITPAD